MMLARVRRCAANFLPEEVDAFGPAMIGEFSQVHRGTLHSGVSTMSRKIPSTT